MSDEPTTIEIHLRSHEQTQLADEFLPAAQEFYDELGYDIAVAHFDTAIKEISTMDDTVELTQEVWDDVLFCLREEEMHNRFSTNRATWLRDKLHARVVGGADKVQPKFPEMHSDKEVYRNYFDTQEEKEEAEAEEEDDE